MTFPRKNIKVKTTSDLELLCIDWIECDEIVYPTKDFNQEQQIEEDEEEEHNKFYKIFLFGVTMEGYSVCIKINNFNPYFYIKVPDDWDEKFLKKFIDKNIKSNDKDLTRLKNNYNKLTQEQLHERLELIRERLNEHKNSSSLIENDIKIEKSEIFWSFTNNQTYKFIKLPFLSKEGYRLYQDYFKHNRFFPYQKQKDEKIEMKLFESNLEPLLRFFHDKDIKPSNWVKIPKNTFKLKRNMSSCQINVEVDYNKIVPIQKDSIPPLIVASFDIEADSSHGDFPLAKKDYKKLANQLVICYLRDKHKLTRLNKSSQEYKTIHRELNSSDYFKNRIIQAFNLNNQGILEDEDISKVYYKNYNVGDKKKNKLKIEQIFKDTNGKFKELCSNILGICNRPVRKVIANQKMKLAINQINILFAKREEYLAEKYKKFSTIKDLIRIIESISKSTKISFIDLKDKILTKEVQVKFVNYQLKTLFPEVKGDKVIQIGTSFWRYGDDKPIYNNIITLKNINDLPNIDKYCYQTEKEVLLEWAHMIKTYDPDIILGYNIFGFDETFLYERALELLARGDTKNADYQKFINMGRLNEKTYKNIWSCRGKLLKKKLASSALGANFLEYFNMPGRVQIDLLKVIQGGLTKLDSYKLDSVAEFYISGKVCEQIPCSNTKTKYKVSNIKELENGNYIILTLKTGEKYSNGKKLIIESVDYEQETITINEKLPDNLMDKSPKWGISKDDVTPKQIFEFQKGTDYQRGLIAKYCIQDCALVIRLLKKLDTIPNNFGMSNVCLVPFNYIFMRGQGIKIFSLVVNECSKNGYKVPVLDKIRKEDDECNDNIGELNNEHEHSENDLMNKKYLELKTEIQNSSISNLLSKENNDKDNSTESVFSLGDNFNKIQMSDEGYEGAIVLEPRPGIYIKDPITVLDFSSLYPSEMIASNLSHDSHCENSYWLGDEGGKRIKELGHDYLDIEYDVFDWVDPKNKNKGKKKVGVTTERFVQYSNGRKGLVPMILKKLLGARKATKKLMKKETEPFKISILDGLQLAYKVTANSLYGQIGASTSNIFKKAIAASTTAGGRRCIYRAKDYCLKNNPGCEVVYGDSVTSDTPILLKNKITGEITFKQIDELNEIDWSDYPNFKFDDKNLYNKCKSKCNNYMVFTSSGWSNIKKVIKHKTNKKIYRVVTKSGVVDVTEDHSLLDQDLNQLKPNELKNGMLLKHNYPIKNDSSSSSLNLDNIQNIIDNIDTYNQESKTAFILGYLFDIYDYDYDYDYFKNLKTKSNKMKTKLQNLLIDVYNYKFNKTENYDKKHCETFINKLLNSCYNKDNLKIIPNEYLNGNFEIKTTYLAGYFAANEYNCKNDNIEIIKKGKIGTSMLFYLIKSVGLNVSIEYLKDDLNMFKLNVKSTKFSDNDNDNVNNYNDSDSDNNNRLSNVTFLKQLSYDEYVYDLETETGNFNCGFPLIVKNTDSVFVKFNLKYDDGTYPKTDQEKVQRSIDIGLALQQKLKDDKYYTPPHDLEYEKVFYPLMLITKKRYAGEKYEFSATDSKFTSMGIVLKRRDNAPILKYVYGGVMNKIMKEKNIQNAIQFVKDSCKEILNNKYDLGMFVISKTLRDYYKDPESIAHKVLADRMGERDPGNKPASNERIPYAYIQVEEKSGITLLQGDKIEHIQYIQENNLKLDYYIYIKNQLLKPICQIFELVVENIEGYPYQSNHFENLYQIYFDKYKNDKKKTDKKISEEKQKVVEKLIFKEFMLKAQHQQNNIQSIEKWIDVNKNEDTNISIDSYLNNSSNSEQVTKPIVKIKTKKQSSITDWFS